MTDKKYELNIFEVLKQANNKNYNWFSSLSPKEKDSFQPWLAMRFMSYSKQNPVSSLLYTNYALNENFMAISKDKELFYRLMCVVGDKTYKSHAMIKPPKKRTSSPIISEIIKELVGEHLEDREIKLFLNKNNMDSSDLEDIAYDFGYDNSKIKEIKKSYDNIIND